MKLRKRKMFYEVPLVERIESVYLDDKKTGFRWLLTLINPKDMNEILRNKNNKNKILGVPNFVCYEYGNKKGTLTFYPIPDKAYEAKCRYITTNEF